MQSHRTSLTSVGATRLAIRLTALAALGMGAPARAQPQPQAPELGSWPKLPFGLPSASASLAIVAASPVPFGVALGGPFGFRHGRRTGRRTFHAGVDFPAPVGTRVFAARSGTVERVVRDEDRTPGFRGYGNAVVIYHPCDDQWTFYAHLEGVTVVAGQRVVAGQPLGAIGNSSNGRFRGMGTHLHFEVRRRRAHGGSPFPGPYRWNNLNPLRWLEARGLRYDQGGFAITDGELVVLAGGGVRGDLRRGNRPVVVLAPGRGPRGRVGSTRRVWSTRSVRDPHPRRSGCMSMTRGWAEG